MRASFFHVSFLFLFSACCLQTRFKGTGATARVRGLCSAHASCLTGFRSVPSLSIRGIAWRLGWCLSVCPKEGKAKVKKSRPPSFLFAIHRFFWPWAFFSFVVLARFPFVLFSPVSPCPPLPPALLSPTTKKGENRRPVKRRSGLSTGRPVCRGLKVDDIRSVSGGSGLSSGRPVCKWTTSALSINIQNAEHPVCKWTPKTSGL